jgi:hypothetical protein
MVDIYVIVELLVYFNIFQFHVIFSNFYLQAFMI